MKTRRQLLKLLGGGAVFGGAALSGGWTRLAHAASGSDLHFIFAYFSGGWDILLGLDPRDPARFDSENLASTLIQPAYELLVNRPNAMPITAGGLTFGPYIGELARHADKLAVIRGMSMETLTHEAGRRRFITGKPPSGLLARGSSIATFLASKLGSEHPIPNLSVRVESYNVDQPSYATALAASGVPDLLRALRPAEPRLGSAEDLAIDALLAESALCPQAERSPTWAIAEASRKKARDMTTRNLAGLFDLANREDLRARYNVPAGAAGLTSPEAQAAMAAQAIMGGVSRAVSFEATNGLDTHFREWATDQGPRQQRGFDAVARLIDHLSETEYRGSGESWLDHTIIVGFSEFSRTPLLNARDGRDHSLTNASFIAGAGIRGGVAVGASSDVGMQPQAVDLATGRLDPGGQVPRPEHVLQTMLELAGLPGDPDDLRVPPIRAIMRT